MHDTIATQSMNLPSAQSSSPHVAVRVPSPADQLALRERPNRSAAGCQRWNRLLFLHWTLPPETIQQSLPAGLHADTFDGKAYIGVVPFFMERIRPAWLPPLPGVSWFLELNVRTYVHDAEGRPGVWFYSLDCNQPLAVALAQRFFHLPYRHAEMRARHEQGVITYECRREGTADTSSFLWSQAGSAHLAEPGSLEFFLVERYLLYSADKRGHLFTGRVHHAPYRIHDARLTQWSALPAIQAGLPVQGEPVSVVGAQAVDVDVFALQPISARS